MTQEENKARTTTQEKEIDLGVFFNMIGNMFRMFVGFFRTFFLTIFNLLLFLLIFIKRNIIWLVLGSLIGFGFGLQRYISRGPSYYSDMVVRSNFESARLLYNRIDYFNSLIRQQRFKDLAAAFGISEGSAAGLIEFGISPIDDDLEATKLYKNTFYDYRRNVVHGVDTQWAKTMKFEDFKRKLNAYDFPLQKVRLYSSSPDVYTKVEQGLIAAVNNNETLKSVKETTTGIYKDEEQILNRSLAGMDSLRKAYNKRITQSSSSQSDGNNMFVADKDVKIKSPEIDLFETELVFKDELTNVKRRAVEQQDILQVYAGFNPTGTKVSSYAQDFSKFTYWGFFTVLGILLLIELYKQIDKIDKKRKAAGNP